MVANTPNPYADRMEASAAYLPGHSLPWLDEQRARAQDKFKSHGFPSPREEEWRYTNVSAIEKKLFSPGHDTSAALTVMSADIQPFLIEDAWAVVMVDGRFVPELSKIDGLPDSVVVTGMADALQIRPDFIEHQLAHNVRDPLGRSYNRTSHLDERRKMMQTWADYLDGLKAAKVIPFKREASLS